MPKTAASGTHVMIANAPNVAMGLPQPKCPTERIANIPIDNPRRPADIFPKRMRHPPARKFCGALRPPYLVSALAV